MIFHNPINCRTPKWEAKNIHEVNLVQAHLTTSDGYVKHSSVDLRRQAYLGEIEHYHPLGRILHKLSDNGIKDVISISHSSQSSSMQHMDASVTTQRESSISHDCLMVLSDKGIKDLISISHSSESSSMQHMEANVTIQRESSISHDCLMVLSDKRDQGSHLYISQQ
ncbi:hypothetical protein AVEN_67402-1 [Araneus ventricosus]|uniref:Uncharacterized protein n=1 Tax=Araneus ventricosus TaxID=182803 RepID=A0A4Y2J2W1_ARAVE|nr:hypothetical protein AVEN_67402-1 [Araneus ventricosus]